MSLRALENNYQPPHAHHGAVQRLAPQFEDIDQQNETYIVGMWTFLVTEVMFFGALFLAYSVYRTLYFENYLDAHQFLSVPLGTVNTGVLLTSSLTMVLAVAAAQAGKRMGAIFWLSLTILGSFGFLGIKYVEYTSKINEGLFPGSGWNYAKALAQHHGGHGGGATGAASGGGAHGAGAGAEHGAAQADRAVAGGASGPGSNVSATARTGGVSTPSGSTVVFNAAPRVGLNTYVTPVTTSIGHPTIDAQAQAEETRGRRARLFFSIYFMMTGLHGVHVLVGIVLMTILIVLFALRHPSVDDYMPTEMVGLYWHFVDLVWIFLFPLMYLIS